MATQPSILAWRVPWTEEPSGLWSVGLQRVGHDLATDTLTIQPEHLLTDLLNACLLAHESVVIRSLRFRMFFCALSL